MQQQGKLADLSQFFSAEELSEYVDAYIQEGYFTMTVRCTSSLSLNPPRSP